MLETKCMDCKFWEEITEIPNAGFCHRYAPEPQATNPTEAMTSVDAIWPRTQKTDWCGEWAEKMELNES